MCLAVKPVGEPDAVAPHDPTLNEVVAGGMISWVLEADLKNFFGSLIPT